MNTRRSPRAIFLDIRQMASRFEVNLLRSAGLGKPDAPTQIDRHCGAIAFSRTGDPALGDFDDAVILKTVGEVDSGLLSG